MEIYNEFGQTSGFSFPYYLAILPIILVIIFYFYKKKNINFRGVPNTKNLDLYAVDLTQKAREGTIDPVIGRDEEIGRVTQILTRRTKNNVILVGQPGVGKTAVVEGLADRIARGEVPEVLKNKRVLLLQVSEILAGTKYRGEFEQRVKGIVQEIKNCSRIIILFIDEIHTITQTKGTEGAVNLSDILKPALARGDLQLIGATTKKEYIKNRKLPDKAIDIMDEAAAMVNVEKGSPHHPAVGLLHGAAQTVNQNFESVRIPIVDIEHVKEVVADWMAMKKEDIH